MSKRKTISNHDRSQKNQNKRKLEGTRKSAYLRQVK